jgi:menaquinone-dependent protoporphyrinogen oxidase
MTVLVAYATKHGSTREVAGAVAETIAAQGLCVEAKPVKDVASLDGYEAVVLGAALYMGHMHAHAREFLSLNRDALATLPVAVFAMGPFTLEEDQVRGSRKQLDAALARTPSVMPISTAIFGGVLDPSQHHFPFSHMPASDARDWEAIRGWAEDVAVEISGGLPARETALTVSVGASSR